MPEETTNTPSADMPPSDEAAQVDNAPEAEALTAVMEPDSEPTERAVSRAKRARGHRMTALIPTILGGVLIFLLGGLGGFAARPYILPPSPTPTQSAAEQRQPDMQAILELLVSKTRHFKGNANAPVTLLEFSDFQ